MDKKDRDRMERNFTRKFNKMLDLVARGRGIEIMIRIAEQTSQGLVQAAEYDKMMKSDIKIPNLHPPKALPKLFTDKNERRRIEMARDISDKLAHGLYREARKLIDKYGRKYRIKAKLNKEPLPGWQIQAKGHLIENGKKIDSIIDTLKSSPDNLIIEEFDVFVHNNYDEAATEIIDDALNRINKVKGSLAVEIESLIMFRGFKRGKRSYTKENSGNNI